MPFVFAVLGLGLLVTAIRGSQGQVLTLAKSEAAQLLPAFAVIGVLGAAGYVRSLRPLADGFMLLVLIALIFANKGIFTQFNAALKTVKRPSASGVASASTPAVTLAPGTSDPLPPGTSAVALPPLPAPAAIGG